MHRRVAMARKRIARALRRHLIEGLIVITPLVVTAAVLRWLFNLVDGLLGRFLYPALGVRIPGAGIVMLIVVLLLAGWSAERVIGSRLIGVWHKVLERIPVARSIYGAARQIVKKVFGPKRPFNEVVLVEYPSPGRWAVGLVAARAPEVTQDGTEERISVFIPNTPNVATGRLIIVPRSKTTTLDLSVDQAFAFALSAGTLTPEGEAQQSLGNAA